MLRHRPAPSRAAASTLCQKCLQRDNYECKSAVQERPYAARPSRSQQLANPKLVPQLNSDVPQDLMRKDGVADAILARKRQPGDSSFGQRSARSRSRSVSSTSSADSVSTISTNLSHSRPHSRERAQPLHQSPRAGYSSPRKRRYASTSLSASSAADSLSDDARSLSSSSSTTSYRRAVRRTSRDSGAQSKRRRRSTRSPSVRGRRAIRGLQSIDERGRPDRSTSRSDGSESKLGDGHPRAVHRRRNDHRRDQDRGKGRDRSRSRENPLPPRQHHHRRQDDREPVHGRRDDRSTAARTNGQAAPPRRRRSPSPRETRRGARSLSPFSKRVALTQTMR